MEHVAGRLAADQSTKRFEAIGRESLTQRPILCEQACLGCKDTWALHLCEHSHMAYWYFL